MHAGKPIIVEIKNWDTFITIDEIKKLHGDCKVRKSAGGIFVVKKGAALRDNAYEYALKHNITIIEIDENKA